MKLGVGIDTKPDVADENQRLEEINESVTERMTGVKGDNGNKGNKGEEQQNEDCTQESKSGVYPLLLSYDDAPSYLKFNPYIHSGYRGFLTTKMCLESMFWWTNETVNIWSHVFGWMLFMGLTLYDLVLLNIHASFADKFIVGVLLVCFQICMILSSLYHTFSCCSERAFTCFLSFDLFGIALSLLAIYMSGIYYAFWCEKEWQMFYLVTIFVIFAFAMVLQIPKLKVDANTKLIVFLAWALYGVVPTFHWTVIMGGLGNGVVQLLLPRVLGMYAISGLAFLIYISKFPERFWSGRVDYLGSSHQWWHLFVVLALYYWHNTGIKYVEFRMNHGCASNMRL
ncbi:progestin and adipoQ receptor family member 3 isoform X1 [Zootermopsis nevadensis]|uniref:progestin and adipoQ receptor family member 3 isoform X1 n=1 Tax=Zootermopsis nevadensis TaxID=136037 RepID=UPI000B8ED35E|nr:progestin and adipoQ receptor family member 3 isoform X1 [Zootermopsis nevadensis]XP_021922006.1 progestin and adipoQ receptor family member 3 isoform X1 [Zootermopsis nevadensis]XP_021922008.1 progestin and adipoQ receptor family member 3 isoform X1 [Zootermopsis nevadensis]XP_021922009.1 progestin and adipoQ receptor family member 3 isoform X1 [Zootermopsis nevadensis]